MREPGYPTPEEAALHGWPEGQAIVVGTRIDGDDARVSLLTNDRPHFEEYEVVCVREDGMWRELHGWGGFGTDTPPEIIERANEIRARFD